MARYDTAAIADQTLRRSANTKSADLCPTCASQPLAGPASRNREALGQGADRGGRASSPPNHSGGRVQDEEVCEREDDTDENKGLRRRLNAVCQVTGLSDPCRRA